MTTFTTEETAPDDVLTRPIIGIENRTAREVFDIMADRRARSTTTARLVVDRWHHRELIEAVHRIGQRIFTGEVGNEQEPAEVQKIADLVTAALTPLPDTGGEPTTWNPDMAAAPRDGTPIILALKVATTGEPLVTCGRWDERGAWDVYPHGFWSTIVAWQPFPAPPLSEGER